jgi:hypothetical protein
MSPVARRIASAVYLWSPQLLCFTCLARQQGLSEHDVRAAALVLVARAGLTLVQAVCCSCGRVDEVLAPQRPRSTSRSP